jgi:hypothetical protein
MACEVSDLIAFVAGAAGGLVNWLGLGNVYLVDVSLFVLHLDCPPLGVSVLPVVVPVGTCVVCVYVHWDGGIVQVSWCGGGIIPSDVGSARLLVGWVRLCEPVPL